MVPQVLHELDRLKTSPGALGFKARRALRLLWKGCQITRDVPGNTADEAFLAIAKPGDVLVTADKGLALLFQAHHPGNGVELVAPEPPLPTRLVDMSPRGDVTQQLYEEGSAPAPDLDEPDGYLLLDGRAALLEYGHVSLVPRRQEVFGLRALNEAQRCAIHALSDDHVELVSLVGPAGTGKTLLAIAAGLDRVQAGAFDKVLVLRNVVPVGEGVGFLPGTLEEKMAPWTGPVQDALDYIGWDADALEGMIETQPLSYLRGRSFRRTFIIVDEAQNTTPHELKTVLTRLEDGCKAVIVGDPAQVDHPRLDAASNGLVQATKAVRGSCIARMVPFHECRRSRLAALISEVM